MTTDTDAKCKCNVCNGKLAFDPNQAGQTIACPHCGMDTVLYIPQGVAVIEAAPVTVLPPMAAPAGEQVYLQEGGVFVSNKRVTIFGRMFAVANISSVRANSIPPSRTAPTILLLVGILFCLGSAGALGVIGFGLLLIAGAVVIMIKQPYTYQVTVIGSGGETDGIFSKDRHLIERTVTAINNAIISRA